MDLVIALEHRFVRTPDGAFRTINSYPRPFWNRYLSSFENVRVVARVLDVAADHQHLPQVDGERVTVLQLPHYVGPAQYLRKRRELGRVVRAIDVSGAAVLLRVPGVVGSLLASALPPGHPYALEVVQDPMDVFAPGTIDHPLRPFFRWWFRRDLQSLCLRSACNLYVTKTALQQRYPPATRSGDATVAASDVEMPEAAFIGSNVDLPEQAFAGKIAQRTSGDGALRIVCVGTLDQLYKRQDELIEAVGRCVRLGINIRLTLVGGGRLMPVVQDVARRVGIPDRVLFTGTLIGGAAVRAVLDESDLFVLPSHSEGLPRAMIEAMARGLPCIGTTVGGVPELLPPYALVRAGDVVALTERILEFARNPQLRERAAEENLITARNYHERVLQPMRIVFYDKIRAITAAWCASSAGRE